MWVLLGIGLAIYLLIFPLIAFLRARRAAQLSESNSEQWAELANRVKSLENKLRKIEAASPTSERAPTEGRPPEVAIAKESAPEPFVAPRPLTGRALPPPPLPFEEPMPKPQPNIAAVPTPSLRVPELIPAPAAAKELSREEWASLEEKLGANWLNKIGTGVFVIGVALFLSYSMRHLGPAGKIAVGYAVAMALLGFGVWGELHERYRTISRAVLGGGWAIAYFTTYAMGNVRAVRLIESPALGFVLLFVVAAAMVAHSLRYHSELTTGFAYVLGFASVVVSRMSVGTLTASALLAASLAVVLWKRNWYTLEPLAIAATYMVHFLWLRQIYHDLGGRKPFPEFGASAALLTVYWLIWMISYFLRPEDEPRTRNLLTASFLINAAGYLAVLHYQSFHPEWRFWFLLGAGAVYMAIAPLATRRARRRAFLLTTTIGAAMIAAAFPYRYSGARVEIVWLIEAETLLVAGWRLAERHLRYLGWLTAAALYIYVLMHDLSFRLAVWKAPNMRLGVTLGTLAAAYYLQAKFFPDRLGSDTTGIDADAARASLVVATFYVLAAAWVALPFLDVGVTWAGVAVVLAETGRRSRDATLQFCGHGSALLAAVRLLSNDLPWAEVYHALGWRTVGLAAAMLYLASRLVVKPAARGAAGASPGLEESWTARFGGMPAVYTWAATLIGAMLIWYQLSAGAIGLGWAMLGLILLEAGRTLRDCPLENQALVLFTLSFARIYFEDLNVTTVVGHIPARMMSVVALAAIYYYVALSAPPSEISGSRSWVRNLDFWFGWGALVALARFELPLAWIAVAWAAMTVILYLVGRWTGILVLRQQAYLLTLLAGMRCAFDNFYQTGASVAHLNTRTVTVISASVLFYVLLGFALAAKRRGRTAESGARWIPRVPEASHE
jgi:hypothetical protein